MSAKIEQFPTGTFPLNSDEFVIARGGNNYKLTWAQLVALMRSAISVPGNDGEDGEDGLSIPGLRGLDGTGGLSGRDGQTFFLEPELPEEPIIIPGKQGEQGIAGSSNSSAPVVLFPEEGIENDISIPPGTPTLYPRVEPYAPGGLKIPNGYYAIMHNQLILTGSQQLEINGTGSLRIT